MFNFSFGLIGCLLVFLFYVLALIHQNFTDSKDSFFVMIAKRLYKAAKKTNKANLVKRFRFFLQLHDGLWSVPLSFFTFWLLGVFLQATGAGVGTYDLGFIQPLLLAICVVVGATNAAVAGLWFTFRGLFRYLFGEKGKYGKIVNGSKTDWSALPVKTRYAVALGMFAYFATLIVIVYLKFV